MDAMPAWLVDESAETILAINHAFSRITGFDLGDLDTLKPAALLAGTETKEQVALVTKTGEKRRGKIHTQLLMTAGIKVYKFIPDQPPTTHSAINDHQIIFDLLAASDFARGCKLAVKEARAALNADFACIYLPGLSDAMLVKAVADESEPLFPIELPLTDSCHHESAKAWTYPQPPVSLLEQTAQSADLGSLLVAPISDAGEFGGLIVAASSHFGVDESALAWLAMLAKTLFILKQTDNNSRLDRGHLAALADAKLIRDFQYEHIKQGLMLVDADFAVHEMNNAAELMLGYSLAEVAGQPVESVLVGAEGLTAALRSASEGISIHDIGNVSIHRRDGQTLPAKVQVLPIVRNEKPSSIAIIIDDISEVQQSQVRAQHLEQRAVIGELSAVFAHEVRNPVNNISTGLQLLELKLGKEDPNLENINRMQNDCQRINHLMESVLAFARPIETSKQDIDLPFMLQRILDRWHPRMMKVNVEPYFQAAPGLPMIKGDNRALERVFINLVSNAVEAMKETGGLLSVKIDLSNEIAGQPHVQVSVSDTGPGIPEGIQDEIFKPFVTTTSDGTGLGLAITYRIVTSHKGTMKFRTFPGGTIFSVFLPVRSGDD